MKKKFKILILSISIFYAYSIQATTQIDSIKYFDERAEELFLEGHAEEACHHYQCALNQYWNFRDRKTKSDVDEGLKLLERLSVCVRSTGQCELIHKYLDQQINDDAEKAIVARIIKKYVKCNQQCDKTADPSFEKQILNYFDLLRVDTSAHLQLKYLLNGSDTEEEEFYNFFYLLERGFVPALDSFDKEISATKRTNRLGWIMLSSLFIIIGLGFTLFYFKREKELLTKEKIALLKGKEKENDRLSIDLHDILGYKIVELKDQINKIEKKHPSNDISIVGKGLDELHESMRYIVQSNLTPESLKFGLAPALETLINRVNNLGVVKFSLYKHGLENRIEPSKEKHIFYLIQELVNNIIKHSKAKSATIEITQSQKEISVLAEDDGIGYVPNVDTLKTIKARTEFIKGNLIEDSKIDHGATIIINVPIDKILVES